jgi:O-antigen ligase
VSAIASAVVASVEFAIGFDWPNHLPFGILPAGVLGAKGFFSNGLTYAGVITITGLFLAGRAMYGHDRKVLKILLWGAFTACFLGLIASKERTYWVSFLPAAAVLFYGKGRKQAAVGISAIFLAGAISIILGPANLREKFSSIFDVTESGNQERIYLYVSGLHMVEDRPLLGWGMGTYQDVSLPYKVPYARLLHPAGLPPGFQTTCHAHNQYLMVAIHSGLIGLGIFAVFIFLAFRSVWRNCDEGIKYGVTSAFTAFLIGGLFEYNGGDAEVATLMFFLLGLAMSGYREPAAKDPPIGTSDTLHSEA